MLLRYIVLHGSPTSEEAWDRYRVWKRLQLGLAECQMADLEGELGQLCDKCPGRPDCPKANQRA